MLAEPVCRADLVDVVIEEMNAFVQLVSVVVKVVNLIEDLVEVNDEESNAFNQLVYVNVKSVNVFAQ